MIQKLQFISRVVLLVCLPAFVLKPVLMSLVKTTQNSNASAVQKAMGDSHTGLKVHYVKQRCIKREGVQTLALTPCFQKAVLTSSMGRVLAFASDSIQHSPPSTVILRI
jgi:hypothetical protein